MSQLVLRTAEMCLIALYGVVSWNVTVDDPDSGMIAVHAEIPSDTLPNRRALTLTFSDTPPDYAERIRSISAVQDDKNLTVELRPTRNRLQYQIRGFSEGFRLDVRYEMDPVFYPPGSQHGDRNNARALMDKEGGILRTRTVFPALNTRVKEHRLTFALPSDWQTLTPYAMASDGAFIISGDDYNATDYIAVGPLEITEFEAEGIPIRVGVFPNADVSTEGVIRLLELYTKDFGPVPGSGSLPRCVSIVAPGFTAGGSAGNRSANQNTHAVTLAHELFHWWNRGSWGNPETRWFGEGATNYVGIVYANKAGLITSEAARSHFADLQGEMRYLEREHPYALETAGRLASEDAFMLRLNYSKGALLMWLLEERAKESNQHVVIAIRRIVQNAPAGYRNEYLLAQFEEVYGPETGQYLHKYVADAERLPELPFGDADGRSGIARFLPK